MRRHHHGTANTATTATTATGCSAEEEGTTAAATVEGTGGSFDIEALARDPLTYCDTLPSDALKSLQRTLNKRYDQGRPLVDDATYDLVALARTNRMISSSTFDYGALKTNPQNYCNTLNLGLLSDLRKVLDHAWSAKHAIVDNRTYDVVVLTMARIISADPLAAANQLSLSQAQDTQRFLISRYKSGIRLVSDPIYDAFLKQLKEKFNPKRPINNSHWVHKTPSSDLWTPVGDAKFDLLLDNAYANKTGKVSLDGFSVDFSAMTYQSGILGRTHQLKRTGALPFRLYLALPLCTFQSGKDPIKYKSVKSTKPVFQESTSVLMMLPESVIVDLLVSLFVPSGFCECHDDNIFQVVYTLCSLELVSKRFHAPIVNGCSIAEEAAKLIMLKMRLPLPPSNFKHALWRVAQSKESQLKDRLYMELKSDYDDTVTGKIIKYFGIFDPLLVPMDPACFLGDGLVQMANGTQKRVCDICVGDVVHTENGNHRAIVRVEKGPPHRVDGTLLTKIVWVCGLGLTPSHPVLLHTDARKGTRDSSLCAADGLEHPESCEWVHPWEVSKVMVVDGIDVMYNFELEGGQQAQDHSVIINGLVVATLGKNVGDRLITMAPDLDALFGTGYWNHKSQIC